MGISPEAVTRYVDKALDGLAAIVRELGDGGASQRPDLPGANSPYAILTHCLGVLNYWGGQVIAGRPVQRDRDAEFRATGPVAPLLAAVEQARQQFRADLATVQPDGPPRGSHPKYQGSDLEFASQGHALLHVMEEVCQHLGQAEITRDLLLNRA